jgi:hypothetical protein
LNNAAYGESAGSTSGEPRPWEWVTDKLPSLGGEDVGAVMTIAFDVMQGVDSAMAIAFLSKFTRTGDSFFTTQAQPAPKAA